MFNFESKSPIFLQKPKVRRLRFTKMDAVVDAPAKVLRDRVTRFKQRTLLISNVDDGEQLALINGTAKVWV